jgi:hypothetical protein
MLLRKWVALPLFMAKIVASELLRRVPQAGPLCEAECFPWANSMNNCIFNNPSVSDPLTLFNCICADAETFEADLLRCDVCIQTLDDNDPYKKILIDSITPFLENDFCGTISSELEIGTSSPSRVSAPAASTTISHASSTSDSQKAPVESGSCWLLVGLLITGVIMVTSLIAWIFVRRIAFKHKELLLTVDGDNTYFPLLKSDINDNV